VAVWSGHGAATRFRLMLPLAPDDTPCAAPAATLPGQGQTVLLLQPDTTLRERQEEALAALGFEPVGYAMDTEVLATLVKSPASCFLLLLGAPTANGQHDAFLANVHRLAPTLAVIACAAEADMASITQTARCVTVPASLDDAVLRKAVTMATGAACQPGAHAPIANQGL
jgi:hypothetical protein